MVFKSQLYHFKALEVNRERLMQYIEEVQQFTQKGTSGAYRRLPLSPEDQKARTFFMGKAKALGLTLDIDAIGNISFTKKGSKDLPPVIIGGHFDAKGYQHWHGGTLSLLMGLEILTTLVENKMLTRRPITLINFTNTEGERFNPNLLGSLVYTQAVPLEEMLCAPAQDTRKLTLGKALKQSKFMGKVQYQVKPAYAFLEIITADLLERHSSEIGLVEATMGHYWTSYAVKAFKLEAISEVTAHIQKLLKPFQSLWLQTYTMPCGTKFFADLRHSNARILNQAQQQLDTYMRQRTDSHTFRTERKEIVRLAPFFFEEEGASAVIEAAKSQHMPMQTAVSTQALDAQVMSTIAPAAVLYLPCNGSIEQRAFTIEKSTQLAMQTVLSLANQ